METMDQTEIKTEEEIKKEARRKELRREKDELQKTLETAIKALAEARGETYIPPKEKAQAKKETPLTRVIDEEVPPARKNAVPQRVSITDDFDKNNVKEKTGGPKMERIVDEETPAQVTSRIEMDEKDKKILDDAFQAFNTSRKTTALKTSLEKAVLNPNLTPEFIREKVRKILDVASKSTMPPSPVQEIPEEKTPALVVPEQMDTYSLKELRSQIKKEELENEKISDQEAVVRKLKNLGGSTYEIELLKLQALKAQKKGEIKKATELFNILNSPEFAAYEKERELKKSQLKKLENEIRSQIEKVKAAENRDELTYGKELAKLRLLENDRKTLQEDIAAKWQHPYVEKLASDQKEGAKLAKAEGEKDAEKARAVEEEIEQGAAAAADFRAAVEEGEDNRSQMEESPADLMNRALANIKAQHQEAERLAQEAKLAEAERLKNEITRLEIFLEEARNRYAKEYKKYRSGAGLATKAKRFIFGANFKDSNVPDAVQNLEKEYDQAAALLGQAMFQAKENELVNANLHTPQEIASLLDQYKKSDIFKRVIIAEQQILQASIENLPPKEKNILKKGWDWYTGIKPTWKKVAVATLLSGAFFAIAAPGTVAAAGGTGAFFAIRGARAVAGSTIGQTAAKFYDYFFEDKSEAERKSQEEKLAKEFGNVNFTESTISQGKKIYSRISEREKQAKEYRLAKKTGVGLVFGGAASMAAGYEVGHALHGLTAEQINTGSGTQNATEGNLPPKTGAQAGLDSHSSGAENFKTESITFDHGKGAIHGIKELQAQIHKDYPDISKAPKSVQDFMAEKDPAKLAMKLGFYDPNSPDESALILKGQVLKFDEHGKLLFGKPDASGNVPELGKFHGKMIDTDHSRAKVLRQPAGRSLDEHAPTKGMSQSETETGTRINTDKISEEIARMKSSRGEELLSTDNTPTENTPTMHKVDVPPEPASSPSPKATAEELKAKIESQIDKNSSASLDSKPSSSMLADHIKGTPFEKENFGLSGNEVGAANEAYQKIYTGRDAGIWRQVKDAGAADLVGAKPNGSEADNAVRLFNSVYKLSGIKPIEATAINSAETVDHYMARALAKITQAGLLDKVKF